MNWPQNPVISIPTTNLFPHSSVVSKNTYGVIFENNSARDWPQFELFDAGFAKSD